VKTLLTGALCALLISACAPASTTPAPTVLTSAEAAPKTPQPRTLLPTPTVPPGRIRESVIAGTWYPDDPDELAEMVDGFLGFVTPIDGEPIALIVPHAGYVYSGIIAAHSFKQLETKAYDVAVVVASDHQAPISNPISVWAEGGFETPLGVVPIDVELAQALVDSNPLITSDLSAHEMEHPIEIQLPFLQRVCPGCSLVPVLMGADDEDTIKVLVEALISLLPNRRAVVIASSDLSHYPSYEDARAVDGSTLGAIETGDTDEIRQTIAASMMAGIPNLSTCACGVGPILVAMQVAAGLGADTVTILRYANSGDSPMGDKSQVVGYGAVMFWHYDPLQPDEAQRAELLALAHSTIKENLETGQIPVYETNDPTLLRPSAAFVTLKKDGELRGCIGHLWADVPLYRIVQQMTVSAATSDPRFPPVTLDELDQLSIEISILSPMRRVTDIQQIEVGTHGLLLLKGNRQGVLLPQVPVDQGWDRETYLDNLCLKAGLPSDCWTDEPTLYRFTAVVFGEE
jgi:AmmeMemoRadiSam system protein B/AmmeMemoRadiSam system protein A